MREERLAAASRTVDAAREHGAAFLLLARVMRVIEEAAEKLQILILTCHPERYRGLEGARFFDLQEIVQGGAP